MTKSLKDTEKVDPKTLEEAIEQIARLQKVTESHSDEFKKLLEEKSELNMKISALFEERDRLKQRLEKKEDMRPPEALSHEVRTLRQEIGAKDSLVDSLRKDVEKAGAAIKVGVDALRAADQRFSNLEATAFMMQQSRDKAQADANAAAAKLGLEEQARRDVEQKLKEYQKGREA